MKCLFSSSASLRPPTLHQTAKGMFTSLRTRGLAELVFSTFLPKVSLLSRIFDPSASQHQCATRHSTLHKTSLGRLDLSVSYPTSLSFIHHCCRTASPSPCLSSSSPVPTMARRRTARRTLSRRMARRSPSLPKFIGCTCISCPFSRCHEVLHCGSQLCLLRLYAWRALGVMDLDGFP